MAKRKDGISSMRSVGTFLKDGTCSELIEVLAAGENGAG